MISVEESVKLLKQGKPVIIFDAENEMEGDICYPSQMLTNDNVLFMSNECKGIICTTVSYDKVAKMEIPVLQKKGSNKTGSTNFIIPIDHKESSTGISTRDRLLVIQEMTNADHTDNLIWPGHQNFLRVSKNGLYERQGHTESSHHLIEMAGFNSATICELVDESGVPRDYDSVIDFSEKHDIPILLLSHITDTLPEIDCTPYINVVDDCNVSVSGKTYIVTGSSSGIGYAIKRKLESMGANVISLSRRDGVDITIDQQIRMKLWGVTKIDGIINCAGYIKCGDVITNKETFYNHISVNVFSILNILDIASTKLVLDAVIINITSNSIYSENKKAGWGIYTASKQMLSTLTQYIAEENLELKVYEVSPSKTFTDMLRRLYPDIKQDECMNSISVADCIHKLIVNKHVNASGSVFHLKAKPHEKALPVFVINMDKDKDRLNLMKERFADFAAFTRFDAVKGSDIKLAGYIGDKSIFYYKGKRYIIDCTKRVVAKDKMKQNEVGCSLSHRLLYEQLVNDEDNEYYVILEDDVLPIVTRDVFEDHLRNLPKDFDLIQLCHSIWYPYEQIGDCNSHYSNITKRYFNGTMSYIISKQCARKLLNRMGDNIDNAADDLLSNAFINGIINVIVPKSPLFDIDASLDTTIH